MRLGNYDLELANKIVNGRCVGNLYVVTQRSAKGVSTILATFETSQAAVEYIARKMGSI